MGIACSGVGGEARYGAHGQAPNGGETRFIGRGCGHLAEALVRNEGLGARVLEDVRHFGGHEVVVDGNQVPARLQGGQVDLDHLGAVGEQGGDDVAHSEALSPQRVNHLVGPAQQLSGPDVVAFGGHQGQVVGVFLSQGPEAEITHQHSPCRSRSGCKWQPPPPAD